MEEKVRISPLQITILAAFFTSGSTLLVIPASMTGKSNQDAWLSALIAVLVCCVCAYFFYVCGKAMGRETYIEYLQRVYGKILGKIIAFTYVFFSFIGSTTLLFYFGNFTTTQILTNTPIEILNLMLAIMVIMVVRAGIEVLARTGELLFPWFLLLFLTLTIFLLPELQFERLSPLYEAKVSDHISSVIDFVATSAFPLVIFLMFIPKNINRPTKGKWNFIIGALIGAGIVSVIVLLCLLVLGAPTTARQMFPSYILAKTVSLYEIIERLESVMAGIWVVSIFFKTALYFYAFVVGVAQLLKVRDYRFLVIPLGILIVLYSTVVYPNVSYMNYWDDTYWDAYALVMGIFIPFITLIIDKLKSIKKK
ncbi:GerAB/ArcD/ProY family transporter [Lederbergia graminis]|uniref:Endospore germination permease n=1 Tax=Lederbergia graminis TaxID=735518 RepID=A0ABW0LCE7_9BACI